MTSTALQKTDDSLREALVEAFERGEKPADIAKRMAPNDKKRAKAIRQKVRYMLHHDERLAEAIVAKAKVSMLMGLPGSAAAVRKRAEHGNIPAAKLLWEASGLHNPRVKHEHSGDIKITLDMPRPNFADEGHITDAEVVDEPAED